ACSTTPTLTNSPVRTCGTTRSTAKWYATRVPCSGAASTCTLMAYSRTSRSVRRPLCSSTCLQLAGRVRQRALPRPRRLLHEYAWPGEARGQVCDVACAGLVDGGELQHPGCAQQQLVRNRAHDIAEHVHSQP